VRLDTPPELASLAHVAALLVHFPVMVTPMSTTLGNNPFLFAIFLLTHQSFF
jgi:hypothetical protein